MIPQDFIHTLLARADIVEVVGRYVTLKKSGANYQACCPFHQEKTPSFTVSATKQFYHCFGCGAHGTAIGFLMEYANLSYVEAIGSLAAQLGMTVPQETVARHEKTETSKSVPDLLEVMQRASQFYRQALKTAPRAIAYLKKRGVTGEVAARFGVGYAPDGWQNVISALADVRAETLAQAGLVSEGDAGKRYDRFRDRIMFPILNQKGNVIAFGGRVLGEGEPKYLNSPETPLFQKGHELYGLFQARRAIREAGRVLVVEGYMDVLALAQFGIGFAVATLGTATSSVHVQKLMRQASELVFCFDGDAAGRRAAWRALEQSLPVLDDNSQIRFLFLPPEHDPDSYVRELGVERFTALLQDATKPLSVYLFEQLENQYDLALAEGRSAFLKAAQPLVMAVKAKGLAMMLRKRAAELAQLDIQELGRLWQFTAARTGRMAQPARPQPVSVMRKLLRLLLFRPRLAANWPTDWQPGNDEDGRAVQALLEILAQHPNLDAAGLQEELATLPEGDRIALCVTEIMWWDDTFEAEAELDLALEQWRHLQQHDRLNFLAQKSLTDLSEAEKQALRMRH